MNPFEFARLVELARALRREIPPYCGTCGCVNLRWAGCDDSWHTGRTAVRSASIGVQPNEPRSGYLVGRHSRGSEQKVSLPNE